MLEDWVPRHAAIDRPPPIGWMPLCRWLVLLRGGTERLICERASLLSRPFRGFVFRRRAGILHACDLQCRLEVRTISRYSRARRAAAHRELRTSDTPRFLHSDGVLHLQTACHQGSFATSSRAFRCHLDGLPLSSHCPNWLPPTSLSILSRPDSETSLTRRGSQRRIWPALSQAHQEPPFRFAVQPLRRFYDP